MSRVAKKMSWWLRGAMAVPPVLWCAQLVLDHFASPALCRSGKKWVLHAITLGFAAITCVFLGHAMREWSRSARRKPAETTFDATEVVAQSQFLAMVAVTVSVFFLMVILATGIPAVFIDPCGDGGGTD